jgi:broad specificity phosphatase PhoE
MNRLILVRAGNTAWAKDNRLQGVIPLPLSEQGVRELRALAETLGAYHPDILYSSGNESAGPTAALLAEACGLKNKKLPDLHELDCGLWQGLTLQELNKRFGKAYRQWRADPLSVSPPDGESVEEASRRIQNALGAIHKKNKRKTVMIAAGPFVSAIVECLITQTPLACLWDRVEKDITKVFQWDEASLFASSAVVIAEIPLSPKAAAC